MTFALDAQTTGMSTIVTTDIDGSRKVYDLNGRSINSETDRLTKGIYVVNSKKIANK